MSAIVLPMPLAAPRSRPLPSLSSSGIVGSSRPLPPLPNQPHHVPPPESVASTPRRSRASATLAPSGSTLRGSLGSVLQEPRILTRFLRYVPWHDFQSLALTCSACSNVLHLSKLRNAVLSRFVPGYRYCLHYADLDTVGSIDVQISDLTNFSEYNVQKLYEI